MTGGASDKTLDPSMDLLSGFLSSGGEDRGEGDDPFPLVGEGKNEGGRSLPPVGKGRGEGKCSRYSKARKAKKEGQPQSAGCPFFLAGDPTLLTRCNQYLSADLLREPFMQGAWSKIPPWGTPCRASCDVLSVDIVNHHGEASCLGPLAIEFSSR